MRRRHLAEVGVKVHHAVAELLHVLRQQLVYVGYPVIQVPHLVVGEAPAAGRVVLRDQEDGTLGARRRVGASGQSLRLSQLRYSLQVFVVQLLGEPLTKPELQLVQTQLQEVVHQGDLEGVSQTTR